MSKEVDEIVDKITKYIGGKINWTIDTEFNMPNKCTICGTGTMRNKKEALTMLCDVDEETRNLISIKFLCPSCASASGVGV